VTAQLDLEGPGSPSHPLYQNLGIPVTNVAGKAGVDVVKKNHAKPDAVGAPVRACCDPGDCGIMTRTGSQRALLSGAVFGERALRLNAECIMDCGPVDDFAARPYCDRRS
jgi:hypothetical protein